MSEPWSFGWEPIGEGSARYWRSARSVDVIAEYERRGFELEPFLQRHAERAGARYWELARAGKADYKEQIGEHREVHLRDLSWYHSVREPMIIVAVETGERRLVMEKYDLRRLLERAPPPAEVLAFWREARTSADWTVTQALLDAMERYGVMMVIAECGVDLGKFF